MALRIYMRKCDDVANVKLESLQQAVGGNIEPIPGEPTRGVKVIGYVNEEGRSNPSFQRNCNGETLLAYLGYDPTAYSEIGLMGPIVITGPISSGGYETPLTDKQRATVRNMYDLIVHSDDPITTHLKLMATEFDRHRHHRGKATKAGFETTSPTTITTTVPSL